MTTSLRGNERTRISCMRCWRSGNQCLPAMTQRLRIGGGRSFQQCVAAYLKLPLNAAVLYFGTLNGFTAGLIGYLYWSCLQSILLYKYFGFWVAMRPNIRLAK